VAGDQGSRQGHQCSGTSLPGEPSSIVSVGASTGRELLPPRREANGRPSGPVRLCIGSKLQGLNMSILLLLKTLKKRIVGMETCKNVKSSHVSWLSHILQPLKIIMTGLKFVPLTLSFKIDLLGQKHFVLLSIGMLQM
jgi:hypothetical protein